MGDACDATYSRCVSAGLLRRLGLVTGVVGLVGIACGGLMLLMPTQVHVDLPAADPSAGVIEDAFFSCGNPLFPGVDPAGEGALPERACEETNQDWRFAGAVTAGAGLALLIVGGALYLSSRRHAGDSSASPAVLASAPRQEASG